MIRHVLSCTLSIVSRHLCTLSIVGSCHNISIVGICCHTLRILCHTFGYTISIIRHLIVA